MALAHYEQQRQLVVDEANAITTVYQRAQVLPEPFRYRILGSLHAYVDARINFSKPIGGKIKGQRLEWFDTREKRNRQLCSALIWTPTREQTITQSSAPTQRSFFSDQVEPKITASIRRETSTHYLAESNEAPPKPHRAVAAEPSFPVPTRIADHPSVGIRWSTHNPDAAAFPPLPRLAAAVAVLLAQPLVPARSRPQAPSIKIEHLKTS
jgi:hypothetical protein